VGDSIEVSKEIPPLLLFSHISICDKRRIAIFSLPCTNASQSIQAGVVDPETSQPNLIWSVCCGFEQFRLSGMLQ